MDDLDQQQAKAAINDLQIGLSLVQIMLVHLTARIANESLDPGAWLRRFTEEIRASIDRVAPPADAQARWMAEKLRARLDALIYGVQTRLLSDADGNAEELIQSIILARMPSGGGHS